MLVCARWRLAVAVALDLPVVPMAHASRSGGTGRQGSSGGLNHFVPRSSIPIASQLDALPVHAGASIPPEISGNPRSFSSSPPAAAVNAEGLPGAPWSSGMTHDSRASIPPEISGNPRAAGVNAEGLPGARWSSRRTHDSRAAEHSRLLKYGQKGKQASAGQSGQNSDRENHIYWLGRTLTSILRHRAVNLGLDIRSDGYVPVKDLLKLNMRTQAGLPLSSHTVDDILKAVERDNKQRFGISTDENNGQLLIRANQGHTLVAIKSEELLEPILLASEIPMCVHGTYMQNLKSIMASGLKRMKRNHVHFACGLPDADGVISGMRSSCNILIYLDAQKAIADGMKFYRSKNNVILTEGFDGVVPSKFFSKIEKWPGRQTIHI